MRYPACWLFLVACVGCGGASSPAARPGPPAIETQTARYERKEFQLPTAGNPGYVGWQACRECHAQRVAECLPTSHFQTCRAPELARMPKAFVSQDPQERALKLPGSDVAFEMSYRDGRFLQAALRDGGRLRAESTIDLVYGAKTSSDEVYLSWRPDESMWELPVAWIYAENCWGAAGFDRHSGADVARELTVRCFECHNTWFGHVPGTLNVYRREGLLLGVTCERCHGPGKQHVAFHREHPNDKTAKNIVLPSALDRERLIEVCTQCHSNAIKHRGRALGFRPGDKLEDHYRSVKPKCSEDDHIANQIDLLRKSKCFQRSDMTCITCHDPHLTDKAPDGQSFDQACMACHQPTSCGAQANLPSELGDKCAACHMRPYVKINVNFDLAHDSYVPPLKRSNHEIKIDPVATKEIMLAWHRASTDSVNRERAVALEHELVAHWLDEATRLRGAGRFVASIAALREALRIKPDSPETRNLLAQCVSQQRGYDDLRTQAEHAMRDNREAEAIKHFEQLLQIRSDDAAVTGRLGTLYAKQGQRPLAVQYLLKATELDADDQYGFSMLAWLAFLDKNYDEACELYRKADAIEPFNSRLNYLWGQSLSRANRLDEAIARYLVAVRSDPRNLDALRALARAFIGKNSFADAVHYAELAVQLTNHSNPSDLMVLAECYLNSDQRHIASQVVTLALEAAKSTQPELVGQIQEWARQHVVYP